MAQNQAYAPTEPVAQRALPTEPVSFRTPPIEPVTQRAGVTGLDQNKLLLGVDLEPLDIDALLGPLAQRPPAPVPRPTPSTRHSDDLVAAQLKAASEATQRSVDSMRIPGEPAGRTPWMSADLMRIPGEPVGRTPQISVDQMRIPGEPVGRTPNMSVDPMRIPGKAVERPVPTFPKRAKAANCLAHGPGLAGGRCGEKLQFTVTTVSEDGEVLHSGGSRVTVAVTGRDLPSKTHPQPRASVDDGQSGSYTVQFVCATPGTYDIVVCVDGMALPMCPIQIQVTSGPPSAKCTRIQGDGAQKCTLGSSAEFTIQAVDEFGNLCTEGGARFGVRANSHAKLHEVADNEDGTYSVTYSVPAWAQGPVRLEVLLDGFQVNGSPLTPRVLGLTLQPNVNAALSKERRGSLAEQLPYLHWLREHPPPPVPEMPSVNFSAGQATSNWEPTTRPVETTPKMAWRAADEWRRLAEFRDELERTREQLAEHQSVLTRVADAVFGESERLGDWETRLRLRETESTVEGERLEGLRSEIRQEALGAPFQIDGTSLRGDSPAYKSVPQSTAQASSFAKSGYRPDMHRSGSAEEGMMFLQREIDQKSRQLQVLEAGGATSPRSALPLGTRTQTIGEPIARGTGASHPMLEPTTAQDLSPARAPQPPQMAVDPPRSLQEFSPPPSRPPIAVDPSYLGRGHAVSPAPVSEPVSRMQLPLGEPMAQPDGRSLGAGLAGLLRAPPPPPAPPPSVSPSGGVGDFSSSSRSGFAGGGGGAETSFSSQATPPQASPEELAQAMRQLFRSFASREAGSVALPGGGRSSRAALGLQDFFRLAGASSLRLSQAELEATFVETADHFGSPSEAGELALAFEVFVELLVETARRQFPDLKDTESASALFELHLLPLARRLSPNR